jgi:hypothetical protein
VNQANSQQLKLWSACVLFLVGSFFAYFCSWRWRWYGSQKNEAVFEQHRVTTQKTLFHNYCSENLIIPSMALVVTIFSLLLLIHIQCDICGHFWGTYSSCELRKIAFYSNTDILMSPNKYVGSATCISLGHIVCHRAESCLSTAAHNCHHLNK